MSKPRVFVTRRLPGTALERLGRDCALDVWEGELPPPREVLCARAKEAQGLLTLLTDRVDEALLSAAPELRVVSNLAVGVDNIDVAACTARGIAVGHTPFVLTETTADFTFALLLAAARHVVEGDRFARSGAWRTWNPNLLLGVDVHGATLGIAGMGAIGQAVARRALGFSMKVLFTHRTPRPDLAAQLQATQVDKGELVRAADFLSLHLPLTVETRHYVGRAELAAMKPTAWLVNVSRGGVVDQPALVDALRSGRPAGAALDVTDPEPPEPGEPLLGLPNVLLAPHLGSASLSTRGRMADLAVDNLLAGLAGRPLRHCVNLRQPG